MTFGEVLTFLLANADLLTDIAEALSQGATKEAIQVAVRSAMVSVSDAAMREELEARK